MSSKSVRHARAGARRRERLLKSALGDRVEALAALDELHDKDYRATLKRATARQKKASAFARQRLKQQKGILALARRERRYEYEKRNPASWACLSAAERVRFAPALTFGSVTFSAGPTAEPVTTFNNRVSLSTTVDAPNMPFVADFSMLEISTFCEFEYVPRNAGLLRFTGYFAPVGSYSLAARGGCLFHGTAILKLMARLDVRRLVTRQDGSVTFSPSLAFTQMEPVFNRSTDADCEADAAVGIFNFRDRSFTLPLPTALVVSAGERIWCFAEFFVQVLAFDGATAIVNLSDPASAELNIPVVLAQLDS